MLSQLCLQYFLMGQRTFIASGPIHVIEVCEYYIHHGSPQSYMVSFSLRSIIKECVCITVCRRWMSIAPHFWCIVLCGGEHQLIENR